MVVIIDIPIALGTFSFLNPSIQNGLKNIESPENILLKVLNYTV